MEHSPSEEDREIADNMETRLFYEEETLNMLAAIPRTASKKDTAYIKECVELVHVVLKMLESFAKQHTVHFVRTKRKRKAKKKTADVDDYDGTMDIDENADEESKRITHERKFEFASFEMKLINEPTIDTYKKFLQSYKELSDREIMWAMSYLHRSFVKREIRVLFFSLEILKLLQDMTSTSSSGLPFGSPVRKEVERFLSYYMSKLIEALERTPSLYVELLFTKTPENWFYFDHGYDKVKESKGPGRTAAVWVFKTSFGLDKERKVAIVIAALLDEDKGNILEWLTQRIVEIKTKRKEEAGGVIMNQILAMEEENIKWVNKEGKLRLLLELFGFSLERDQCIVPGYVSLEELEEAEKWLKRYLFMPVQLEDGMVAADYLRRKRANESVNGEENDSGMDDEVDEEMTGFIANDEGDGDEDDDEGDGFDDFAKRFADPRFNVLPEDERLAKSITSQKDRERRKLFMKKESNKKKKIVISKKKEKDNSVLQKELEKQRKIKSSAFVHDSDDESDEERDREFFESERKLREMLSKVNSGEKVVIEEQASSRTASPKEAVKANSEEHEAQSESESEHEAHKSESESESQLASESEAELTVKKRRAIIVDDDDE